MTTILNYIHSMDYLPDLQYDYPINIYTYDGNGNTLNKYSMNISYASKPITIASFVFQ
jgi:hypothetical protein